MGFVIQLDASEWLIVSLLLFHLLPDSWQLQFSSNIVKNWLVVGWKIILK
jgi:hypothetical protein